MNNLDSSNVFIFSDSLSAISAIDDHLFSDNNLDKEIAEIISNYKSSGTRVTLCWIPSDVDIEGNVTADKLVTEGHINPSGGKILNTLTPAELIVKFKSNRNAKIFEYFIKYMSHDWVAGRKFIGPRPWFVHSDRKITRAPFRLRSEHNGLRKSLSKIDKSLSSQCRHGCEKDESVEHVLLYYRKLSEERNEMSARLTQNKIPITKKTLRGVEEAHRRTIQNFIRCC